MTANSHEILLVDADPRERHRLAEGLESLGWKVWAVTDAAEAMRLCQERAARIHAALVDYQLPGFEGSRILAELGRLAPALLRCAMCSGVSDKTAQAFRRMTATPLFAKPVQVQHVDLILRWGMQAAASDAQPTGRKAKMVTVPFE